MPPNTRTRTRIRVIVSFNPMRQRHLHAHPTFPNRQKSTCQCFFIRLGRNQTLEINSMETAMYADSVCVGLYGSKGLRSQRPSGNIASVKCARQRVKRPRAALRRQPSQSAGAYPGQRVLLLLLLRLSTHCTCSLSPQPADLHHVRLQ